MKRTWFITCGAIVLAAVLLLAILHKPRDSGQRVLHFGFIGPLSGEFAAFGEIERNSIQLAVDEIDSSGGVNGMPIKVSYEDDQCMGSSALSAAHKLVEVQDSKILLITCSQSIPAVAPFTEKVPAIVFASYAVASNVSQAGDYVFRNSYSNKDIARTAAETIVGMHQKIALITETSAYSSSFRDDFESEFQRKGGVVTPDEQFIAGRSSVNSAVAKILAEKPSAIFINTASDVAGVPLIKQIRLSGYQGQLYTNFMGASKNVQSLPESEGMIFFADPVVGDSLQKKRFLDKYKMIYGTYPDYEYPAAARYDSVYILAQAIEKVGDDPTSIKNYLYHMPDFSGALGTYRFDSNGDLTNVVPTVDQIENGKAVKFKG